MCSGWHSATAARFSAVSSLPDALQLCHPACNHPTAPATPNNKPHTPQELDDIEAKFRLATQQFADAAEDQLSQLSLANGGPGGSGAKRRPQRTTPYALGLRAGLGGWVAGLGLTAGQLAENVEAGYKKHQPEDPRVRPEIRWRVLLLFSPAFDIVEAGVHITSLRTRVGEGQVGCVCAGCWSSKPRFLMPVDDQPLAALQTFNSSASADIPILCPSPPPLQVAPLAFAEQFVTDSGGFSRPEAVVKAGRHMAAIEVAAEPLVRQAVRKHYQVRLFLSFFVLAGQGWCARRCASTTR